MMAIFVKVKNTFQAMIRGHQGLRERVRVNQTSRWHLRLGKVDPHGEMQPGKDR
jgi:hypothetical protein